MESSPCAIGDVLAGKYRVERVLGEGGMGVVVAARHTRLDQLVAIKILRPSLAEDGANAERFLREARAAAKLRTDHVARVLDVGTLESGLPYLVMEFLEGADLASVLAGAGALPVETACDYVLQACEAVAEAHALGIVHRDLKPENLFLARRVGGTQVVKVLDFGVSKVIARNVQALTTTRGMVGSPLYMAPEQLRASRSADPRADVWALGVVLYELLTERWPFEAESLADLCLKVVGEEPRRIDVLRTDLPSGLVAVVQRCLEKEPELRYANAAELASALAPFAPAPSGVLAERARLAVSSLSVTQQAPANGATSATTGPVLVAPTSRRGLVATALMALLAVSASAYVTWTQATRTDDRLTLGAVRAALGVPLLAGSPPPAIVATSAPATATSAEGPTPGAERARPTVGMQPGPARAPVVLRHAPRITAPVPAPDDDIPAFR